jgi:uncharacterized repeat protein (TIGR01451 family)
MDKGYILINLFFKNYLKQKINKTDAGPNWRRRIPVLLITVVIGITFAGVSYGDIIINAPMTGTDSTGWVLGGSPASSSLTGNGTIDAVGSGWLRLTDNTGNQTGYAYNTTTFDLSQGLLIQFDYATWGGSGADGYSVYLFDAGVSTFNIGAFGGSLGYAQKTGIAGISGGYVGIGVDEFGNFSNPTEGRYLGTGAYPNTVTVRGSVVGFGSGAIGSTTSTSSYPWIATSVNSGSLWYSGTVRPDQTSTNYRRVTIQISPAPNPVANVWIQFGYNTTPVQMISGATLPAISTSQQLRMGYAASTGGSTNYHEIRSLLVTNAATTTAIDLGVTKTIVDSSNNPVSSVAPGGAIRYLVTATNNGPNNVTATGAGITDNIPTSITGVTWTCAASGGATCVDTSGSGNTLSTTANLPRYGSVTYTIDGTVSASAGSTISNTASLVIPGAVSDYNSSNDSVTATVTVSVATTGNKPLYLIYDSSTTGHLNRTRPTVSGTTYVQINGGSSVSWALSPVLQSAVTINGATGTTIPVTLRLATNSSRTYSLNPITLSCGSTTLGTLTTGSVALTGTVATVTFNVPHTATQICAAGTALTLSITNTQTSGRYVYVYPAPSTGNYSYVNLLSQNVINVDSVGFYSASYLSGGGTSVVAVAPGQTVYIRATVSDPFGSYDITSAAITLTDSASGVKLSSVAMTQRYDSGYANKIYEYAYTVPAAGPTGTWTATVTAKEGSENTVNHSLTQSFTVGAASLTIVKSANKSSASTGDIITYTMTVSNSGSASANSVTAVDSVPAYTTYVANSTRLNSITVYGDGSTSPLAGGLLLDNNASRSAGTAATGVLPAGGSATVVYQVTVK